MWLFLWIVFVLAMVGFFVWSYHATYEQKRAWKIYASKFNLQYFPNKMMQPPTMTGEIKGRLVNFYPQIVENAQGQKSTQTVVEVFLNKVPDFVSVVGSAGFGDFVQMLDLPEPFEMGDTRWPQRALSRGLDVETAPQWFNGNAKRIEAMAELFKLPMDKSFFVDGEQAFVVIRTPNTLSNPKKINQILGKLFEICTMLEVEDIQPESKPEQEKDSDKDKADEQ